MEKQNDYQIEDYAKDKQDLDMALYYVLDQVQVLEIFNIHIIRYFEHTARGEEVPVALLGGFKPVVLLVEEWIYSESNVNPRSLEEFTEYV